MFGRGLIFVALFAGALWFFNQYQNADGAQKDKIRKLGLLYAAAGVLILLVVTGHANPLLALLSAAVPWIHRAIAAKSVYDSLRAGHHRADYDGSRLNTRFLTVSIDPKSGELAARIVQGRHQGRSLDELDLDQLVALFTDYQQLDAESATVLATWLDRSEYAASWRQTAGASRAKSAPMTSALSLDEAAQVLGVDSQASRDDIVSAHRKLMHRVHPDRGGVDWLAAKVNEAKRVLLDHLKKG